MFSATHRGSFDQTTKWLEEMEEGRAFDILEKYAIQGMNALIDATPIDSGRLVSSWGYEVKRRQGHYSIVWTNDDIEGGQKVAILIQYGHGTGTGGWVQGIDYINPAIQPLFKQIADEVWKEVTDG